MKNKKTNKWLYTLYIGTMAGLGLWGFHRLFHYLHFTKFKIHNWWVELLVLLFFSIVSAFLYMLILGRFKGPVASLCFGFGWWIIVAMLFLPYHYNTLATELALLLVWGLFIGYSYAYEFHDEAAREPHR